MLDLPKKIKYYTNAKEVCINEDASYMFYRLKNLKSVRVDEFSYDYTKNMNYISINFPDIFNKIQNSLYNNSFQYEINQKKNNGFRNYETGFKIPANCPCVKKIIR